MKDSFVNKYRRDSREENSGSPTTRTENRATDHVLNPPRNDGGQPSPKLQELRRLGESATPGDNDESNPREILDRCLVKSFAEGKTPEECLDHVMNIARQMGNRYNPLDNIEPDEREWIKRKLINKCLVKSFAEGKTPEECLDRVINIARKMGNVRPSEERRIQNIILDKYLEGSFAEGKTPEECLDRVINIARKMGDAPNPLDNIEPSEERRIQNIILEKCLVKSFAEGKTPEECLDCVINIARKMGDAPNPLDNIEPDEREWIKRKLINKCLVKSFAEGKTPEECFDRVINIARKMGDAPNPLDNIERSEQRRIQNIILEKCLVKSFAEGKTPEECFDRVINIARKMGDAPNPLDNVNHHERIAIQSKISQNVMEKTWNEKKGESFIKRSAMCEEAVQSAAVWMGIGNIEGFMNSVRRDLTKKKQAMDNDIKRWQTKGLPGRGWSTSTESKDYENYKKWRKTLPFTRNRNIFRRKRRDIILPLYWQYGARASIKIDKSKLGEPPFAERMHPYLQQLERAEKELKQQVHLMCYFHLKLDKMNEMNPNPEKRAGLLDAFRESWILPALEKYNTTLDEAKEAYECILSKKDTAQ